MASESTAKVVEKKAPSAVPKDRRYVGSKETFAYILDDIAQSFNIGKYDDVFKMYILKIDLVLQSVTNGIISVWDIINDIFLAAIVDKTRTRWGKFKPWLVVYAIPGVFLTMVYWALPMFYGTEGIGTDIPRFAIYLLLQIFAVQQADTASEQSLSNRLKCQYTQEPSGGLSHQYAGFQRCSNSQSYHSARYVVLFG